METKQQFLEEINKVKGSKRDYLNKLFQYVLEAVIRAAVHKNVKKGVDREGGVWYYTSCRYPPVWWNGRHRRLKISR